MTKIREKEDKGLNKIEGMRSSTETKIDSGRALKMNAMKRGREERRQKKREMAKGGLEEGKTRTCHDKKR